MSKYTTEVRYIFETVAKEIDPSINTNDVLKVCKTVSYKFLDIDEACEYYYQGAVVDETRRFFDRIIPQIFIRNYTREICCETVGLWKLRLQSRFNDIFPYYVDLFKSLEYKYDPLIDTDYETSREDRSTKTDTFTMDEHIQDTDDNTKTINNVGSSSSENQNTVHNTGTNTDNTQNSDRYSDTPQGTVQYLEISENMFLTNARLNDSLKENEYEDTNETNGEVNTSHELDVTENEQNNKTINKTGTDVRTIENGGKDTTRVKGKMGTTSYAKMIVEYRKSLMNVSEQFFNEFNDLFMLIY